MLPLGWSVAGREALALARQAYLLRHDTDVVLPARAAAGDDVVVLLHGLFASAGVLRPLRDTIEHESCAHVASFSYLPGSGVRVLAARLANLVLRMPDGVRVHLVGHSLGGLVVRWYVQMLGGDPRVVQTISLATPFGGTDQGRWMPGPAGRDISPGSATLLALASSAPAFAHVPHTSFVAAADTLVTPPDRAAFVQGEVVIFEGLGHNTMLYAPRAHAAVVRQIRAGQAVLAAPRPSW